MLQKNSGNLVFFQTPSSIYPGNFAEKLTKKNYLAANNSKLVFPQKSVLSACQHLSSFSLNKIDTYGKNSFNNLVFQRKEISMEKCIQALGTVTTKLPPPLWTLY